jgi:transposase
MDSTTQEANASLHRLARKDTGASYRAYVKEMMPEAGEDPADTDALNRFDKNRKGKSLSNQDWRRQPIPTYASPR